MAPNSVFFKGRIWRVKPSSYRYKTVQPKVKSQHTTRLRGHCWSPRWLPARLTEGRGQLCFPLWQPHPKEFGCQSRFRRDVLQSDCFVCRLRRCKTAAVPEDLLSRVNVLSGTACPTVLSACLSSWLPQNSHQLFFGESRGPRATCQVAAAASHFLSSRSACAGSAAVLHRLRRPSREQLCLRNRFVESNATQLRSRRITEGFG